MHIQAAKRWDVGAIAALEALCLPSDPWSAEALADYAASPDCIVLLATLGDRAVGYVLGRTLAPEAELYRIATHPDHRREGIGGMLLAAFLGKCHRAGCHSVFLEVRASNGAARALYASLGFEEIGLRRGYYTAPKEDAIVMQLADKEVAPC